MNSFISQLLDRHTDMENNIRPRIKGRFDMITDNEENLPVEKEPMIETGEAVSTPVPSSLPVWKNQVETIDNDHVTNKFREDSNEENPRSSAGAFFIPGTINKMEEDEKQQMQVNKMKDKLPRQPEKIAGDKESSPSAPAEKIVHPLRRKYLERVFPVKINDQPGQDEPPGHGNFTVHESLPASEEPINGLLIPGMGEEKKDNQAKMNVLPLPVNTYNKMNAAWNDQLSASAPGITTTRVINVSIGRIEIRAGIPAADSRTVLKKENKAALSLDQYLDQRKSGK